MRTKTKKKTIELSPYVRKHAGVYANRKEALLASNGNERLADARMAAQELGAAIHKGKVKL